MCFAFHLVGNVCQQNNMDDERVTMSTVASDPKYKDVISLELDFLT